MSERRGPKKSETLEVRLSHEDKAALMLKAQAEGRSASAVIRASIDSYLAEQPTEARSMLTTIWKPAGALGAAALAFLGAGIATTPVHARPDLRAVFQAIDADGNNAITPAEFSGHPSNPRIQKIHQSLSSGAHADMAAMHGHGGKEAHVAPSDQQLRSHFAKLDANADGSIAWAEFESVHGRMTGLHSPD